jgi:hypothetical protein
LKNQTAAVAVAATVGGVDNVAALDIYVTVTSVDNAVVDIYVAETGVDHAVVGIPVAVAADVANAAGALSNNFASCFLCRVLHSAVLSVIKHTAELGCGKGLAAGIFRHLAHPTLSELRPAKRLAATDCKRLALNRQNAATAGYNGRRLNGLACRYFSQVRNRGALCQASKG